MRARNYNLGSTFATDATILDVLSATLYLSEQCVSGVAREMIRIREVVVPRPDRVARFHQPYLRLVEALARRGWIRPALREHAERRTR